MCKYTVLYKVFFGEGWGMILGILIKETSKENILREENILRDEIIIRDDKSVGIIEEVL